MSVVLPSVDDGNRPFWDGCRDGVLRLQRCATCERLRYPIAPICPACLSAEASWEAMSGHGEVYSFVVFRHAYNEAWRGRLPYAVALVRLDEGPTMLTNLTGVDPADVTVGLRVRAVFERAAEEIWIPSFTRAVGG